jgi:hypothetical protein
MAKFSMKKGGKEVGQASVYAEPHNMKGQKGADVSNNGYFPEPTKADKVNMSVGNITRDGYNPAPYKENDGIKIRGTGAATKGTRARGPMG